MKRLLSLVAILALVSVSWGYVFIQDSSTGLPLRWPAGTLSIKIMADNSTALSDGTTRATSIQKAMQDSTRGWNRYLGDLQFSSQILSPGSGGVDNNHINEIFFSADVYGQAWGTNVLAVTTGWSSGAQRTEADIIFNSSLTWDSYRGNLQATSASGPFDIQRVALHELGHVLGLGHPDLNGQSVTAIMNSSISNIDSLQQDDIDGAQSLYGVPGFPFFVTPPLTQSALVGHPVAFTASVYSQTAVTYAWRHNGQTIPGVTGSSLSLAAVSSADAGNYELIATNALVSVSSFFQLHVTPAHAAAVAWGYDDAGQTVVPADIGQLLSLSGGTRHTLALKTDGTIAAWGQSFYAQTTIPSGLSSVVEVAAGGTHSLALTANGSVVAWGDNNFGTPGAAAVTPGGLWHTVAVAAGWGSSMALRADGTVVTWGFSSGVAKPSNLTGVTAIAAGAFHNLALRADGTVVGWGDNSNGAVTIPAGLTNVIAIDAGGSASGGHSLALKQDGTVVAWGYNAYGQCTVPAGLNNVVAIAAGGNFSLALKADGTIVAWGQNDSGQLDIPAQASACVAVNAGYGHVLALVVAQVPVISAQPVIQTVNVGEPVQFSVQATGLGPLTYRWKRNGSALSDGGSITGSGSSTLQINNAQAADAGSYTVDVSNAGGTVTSNGAALVVATPSLLTLRPASRILPEGALASFTVAAAAGGPFTYQWRHGRMPIAGATGATFNVSAVTYGDSGYYEALVTNAAGGVSRTVFYLQVAVANPSLVAWGDSLPAIPLITGSIAEIEIGSASFALKGDGTVVGWGNNSNGQASVPAGLSGVVGIASGGLFTLALKSDGTVVGWGDNSSGETTPPGDLHEVVAIAAGPYHALALKSDGTVVGWGNSQYGQHVIPDGLRDVIAIRTGDFRSLALRSDGTMVEWGNILNGATVFPGPTGSVSAIASGESHAVALRQDGTVAAWGSDYAGSTVVPVGLSGVTAVAAGASHSLALKSDGSVVGWGRNYEHQATPPTGLAGVLAITAGGWQSMAMVRSTIPVFATSPADHSAVVSGGASFAVVVNNLGTINYQWQRQPAGGGGWGNLSDGGSYAGATDASLTLTGITLAMNGDQFRCVATNAAGSTTSSSALLTVAVPLPTITTPPTSQTAAVGAPVTFSVTASSLYPLSYQWRKNGSDITGANLATYSIASVQLSDAAVYRVVVTNSYGSVTSPAASLAVQALVVTNNGGVAANADGSLVTLSINVTGTGPFTYQWYTGFSGDTSAPVAGGTASSIIVPQSYAQGSYWVRVSNGIASTDSATIPLGKWKVIDPLFGSAELSAVTYGGGKYVVVGTAVGHSANALDWQMDTIEAGADLHAVLYDGTRYVAGGVRGQVFTSADGIAWQKQRAADAGQYSENVLGSGAYGNGITVFAGGREQIMSSTDGQNWAWRPVIVSGEVIDLVSVAFGAGRFVAVGQDAMQYAAPRIYQSVDGVNWSRVAFSTVSPNPNYALRGLTQVVFFGGRFAAIGQVQYTDAPAYLVISTDGVTWNAPVLTNVAIDPTVLTQGAGQLLSADFRTSADGINWSAPQATPPRRLDALGYGNGVFISLKSNYDDYYASIATSTDFQHWTTRVGTGVPGNVAYGNDRFVAVSRDRTAYSLDGLNWTVTGTAGYYDYGDVTFGNGLFVSVSTNTSGSSHFTSTDGVTWTPQRAAALGQNEGFSGIIYAGGQWVGYGASIYTSPDAIHWTRRFTSSSIYVGAMAYGGGLYVGVSYAGGLVVSADGNTWSTPPPPTTANFAKITYGAGMFVASDSGNGLWSSRDGLQWTARPLPAKNGGAYLGYMSSLKFGGGWFLAAYGSDLLSSTDGITWQLAPSVLPQGSKGFTFSAKLMFGAGSFWCSGSSPSGPIMWLHVPIGSPLGTFVLPTIATQPANQTVTTGTTVTFIAVANGAPSPTYQWRKNGVSIAGATRNTFTIGSAAIGDTGSYTVVAANSVGSVSSDAALLVVMDPPSNAIITITVQ